METSIQNAELFEPNAVVELPYVNKSENLMPSNPFIIVCMCMLFLCLCTCDSTCLHIKKFAELCYYIAAGTD